MVLSWYWQYLENKIFLNINFSHVNLWAKPTILGLTCALDCAVVFIEVYFCFTAKQSLVGNVMECSLTLNPWFTREWIAFYFQKCLWVPIWLLFIAMFVRVLKKIYSSVYQETPIEVFFILLQGFWLFCVTSISSSNGDAQQAGETGSPLHFIWTLQSTLPLCTSVVKYIYTLLGDQLCDDSSRAAKVYSSLPLSGCVTSLQQLQKL